MKHPQTNTGKHQEAVNAAKNASESTNLTACMGNETGAGFRFRSGNAVPIDKGLGNIRGDQEGKNQPHRVRQSFQENRNETGACMANMSSTQPAAPSAPAERGLTRAIGLLCVCFRPRDLEFRGNFKGFKVTSVRHPAWSGPRIVQ